MTYLEKVEQSELFTNNPPWKTWWEANKGTLKVAPISWNTFDRVLSRANRQDYMERFIETFPFATTNMVATMFKRHGLHLNWRTLRSHLLSRCGDKVREHFTTDGRKGYNGMRNILFNEYINYFLKLPTATWVHENPANWDSSEPLFKKEKVEAKESTPAPEVEPVVEEAEPEKVEEIPAPSQPEVGDDGIIPTRMDFVIDPTKPILLSKYGFTGLVQITVIAQ